MSSEANVRAIDAPNLEVEIKGRHLAYRSMGTGKPIVLCARFRGNMDSWDPAFLDALVASGFRVITFDYSGIGLSTGDKNFSPVAMAEDARDVMEALDLQGVVISGWSLGGMVAQVCVALHPHRISHAVLIGTVPPGPNVKPAEQLFYDTAVIPNYTLENEITLFFEPRSPASRQAGRRSVERIASRTKARSNPVPLEWSAANLGDKPRSPLFPADAVLTALKATKIPLLHIGGDHDIIFPVENWYALNQELPTLQLLTYPQAGHGPHHQHPEAVAQYISIFVTMSD
jgi:pimeloyl-ACP methyl ester carboxylesterase